MKITKQVKSNHLILKITQIGVCGERFKGGGGSLRTQDTHSLKF